MKLVIAGSPAIAIPSIQRLRDKHSIVIVTQPDAFAGRSKKLKPTPIAEHFPDALKPETERELIKILESQDLLITIGYGRILSKSALQTPRYGAINLHFSLLPKWRGAAPVQRCIEAGDSVSGVTVFQMDEGLDTGDIWTQEPIEIPSDIYAEQLFDQLAIIGSAKIEEAINMIESAQAPVPQKGTPTYARKVDKSECRLDWSRPADQICRKVQAFSFNPGITTTIRDETIRIDKVMITSNKLESGHLNSEGLVGTGTTAIQLLEVTPSGKRRMSAKDWLNGFRVTGADVFK